MKTNAPSSVLMEKFAVYFRDMTDHGYVKAHNIYADNVVFKDPIHEIHGLDNLNAYFSQSVENLFVCRFEFLDQLVADNSAYIKWNMHYLHPKISKQTLTLRGITHIRFEEKIIYHEDVYDVGSMVYEHLPLLGPITHFIKKKIAGFKR